MLKNYSNGSKLSNPFHGYGISEEATAKLLFRIVRLMAVPDVCCLAAAVKSMYGLSMD